MELAQLHNRDHSLDYLDQHNPIIFAVSFLLLPMARKPKNKGLRATEKEAIASRPRRSAARRSVATYREESDSEFEDKQETPKYVKSEKKADDDTVDTKSSSSSAEDEEISELDGRHTKTKLASKKSSKASTDSKKLPLRKNINEKIKRVSGKRKRTENNDIDDSRYIVSPPKKIHQQDDSPVDWRVHTAVDY